MGSTHQALVRLMPPVEDGFEGMPSARVVSNLVCDQEEGGAKRDPSRSGPRSARFAPSDMVWQWGQFLDHDLDLTEPATPAESVPIEVPIGDADFDPFGGGQATIAFERSGYISGGTDGPREQVNEITAWIDGSNVYGADEERAAALRAYDGSGRLASSSSSVGELLPFNDEGLPNAGGTDATLFLAGDVRANEQLGLTVMHTLFMREHNYWADLISSQRPEASGDEIYEAARIIVTAEIQIITYREFLPILLGADALPDYQGYDATLDARILNEFSTAAYRFGHSMLSPQILRLESDGSATPEGALPLRDAFFSPWRLESEGGIEPILRGLARQAAQTVDPYVVDDVRNFLFGPPGAGGFDLAALNIQRGRDHGLPSYNALREARGMGRAADFSDVSSDKKIAKGMRAAYRNVDQIDLWVGGLAEDPVEGALVGPLFRSILVEQFRALRDGDRFWYEHVFPPKVARWLERRARLSRVIRRNTSIGREIPGDVFMTKVKRAGKTAAKPKRDHRSGPAKLR